MPFDRGLITDDAADQLNEMQENVRKLAQVSGVPPINANLDDAGLRIELSENGAFPVVITSGSNPYSWTEQEYGPDGTFVDKDGGRTGVDNLWEAEGFTQVVAGSVELARPSYFDPTTFQNYIFWASGDDEGGSSSLGIVSYEVVKNVHCGDSSGSGDDGLVVETRYHNVMDGLTISYTDEPLGEVQ